MWVLTNFFVWADLAWHQKCHHLRMPERPRSSRFEAISRRAVLKATAGAGFAALVPGVACASGDAEVFAGAVAGQPTPTTTTPPAPSPTPTTTTAAPTAEATATPAEDRGVSGDLVISFTYMQGVGGKNERPYIAVWVEDPAGNLVHTVSLWYQQARRGERWLDHLLRWYPTDASNATPATTISSATREAGAYAVAWDGTVDDVAIPSGDYVLCIESAREDGPYSLICEPLRLAGALEPTELPSDGELSAASVRIDA